MCIRDRRNSDGEFDSSKITDALEKVLTAETTRVWVDPTSTGTRRTTMRRSGTFMSGNCLGGSNTEEKKQKELGALCREASMPEVDLERRGGCCGTQTWRDHVEGETFSLTHRKPELAVEEAPQQARSAAVSGAIDAQSAPAPVMRTALMRVMRLALMNRQSALQPAEARRPAFAWLNRMGGSAAKLDAAADPTGLVGCELSAPHATPATSTSNVDVIERLDRMEGSQISLAADVRALRDDMQKLLEHLGAPREPARVE
eukprot:1583199-Prymnesium_polylepis.1